MTELVRADPAAAAEVDALLQETVARLLAGPGGAGTGATSEAKSVAAGVIARRLCAPRDMGVTAATQLRALMLEMEVDYAP